MTIRENARLEVLAAIGTWALHDMQGQPERIEALFDDLAPGFRDIYPHHKLLAHLCQEARELRDVTPGKKAVVEVDGAVFLATLSDGRKIEDDEIDRLGEHLVRLGYEPEEIHTVASDEDYDRSLMDGQRIALILAMRKGKEGNG